MEPDGTVLLTTPANLWRGREAVGGMLTVTSEGLVFSSHALNFQTGETRLPFGGIVGIAPVATLGIVPNGLEVTMTDGARHRLVVWRRGRLLKTIEEARAAFARVPPIVRYPRG